MSIPHPKIPKLVTAPVTLIYHFSILPMAPPPMKLNRPANTEADDQAAGDEIESNHLWVGNIAREVTESDLLELFAPYGALDSVTSYSARSFAFAYFKRVEDAKQAKDALQGASLHGNPIRIQFARPAKPGKNLWVGGISSTVSKEQLEEEFLKFGKIEDITYLKDRNTAYVEYVKLEDASQAVKNMNGKKIGGEQIRVDFLRSQSSRREQLPDFRDSRENQLSATHYGVRRPQLAQSPGGPRRDGQPSNVLWVGYPPSVLIDEQMLHNAMILFGEIERIKSFPSRHYSFVEFRSVDEARRAKEGLQGRLFNDPRITIMFSSSGLAPGKDYSSFYPGVRGSGPDMFNEHPYAPMDIMFDRPGGAANFAGPFPPNGIHRPNLPVRPFGPQGSFDPVLHGSEFNELASLHGVRDPASGILHSPVSGIRPSMRSVSSGWDVLDPSQVPREAKRSRIDAASVDDDSFLSRTIDDRDPSLDKLYGLGSRSAYPRLQGNNSLSPVGSRVKGHFDNDFIWRGIVAKGGTPVCHARCVPVGEGIQSEIPPVINCSARTGLDMLAKHYAEAIGFDIVFFLPDSEDDFASYTEFLRYLGSKNRAGVAKFDDGTTLFLVPPSDFLTNVLKVEGPERLYGVVLKLPQQVPSNTSMQQQLPQPNHFSQYMDNQIPPLEVDYNLLPQQDERVMPIHHNRILHEDSKLPSKSFYLPTTESVAVQPVPQEYASNHSVALSATGVLTPELIATLASFLPGNNQSASSESGQPALASSTIRPPFSSVALDNGPSSQGWKHDNQVSGNASHSQLGNQFNSQVHVSSQFQSYPSVPNTFSHSANVVPSNSQVQDSTVSLPHQSATPSRLLTGFSMPSQSGQFALSAQGTNDSQAQFGMSLSSDIGNWEPANQVQQLQAPVSAPVQASSDIEADKNQRYQSTLQFAANLLLQIQQRQQQQNSNPAAQGSGNQQ